MSNEKISEERRAAVRSFGERMRVRRRQSALERIIEDIDDELEYRSKERAGEVEPRERCPIPELEAWVWRDCSDAYLKYYRLELVEKLAKLSA